MARQKPFGVRLGEKARVRRLALGVTQDAVAEKAGITTPELCRLEKGHLPRGPAAETVAKLAGALGIPVTELMTA